MRCIYHSPQSGEGKQTNVNEACLSLPAGADPQGGSRAAVLTAGLHKVLSATIFTLSTDCMAPKRAGMWLLRCCNIVMCSYICLLLSFYSSIANGSAYCPSKEQLYGLVILTHNFFSFLPASMSTKHFLTLSFLAIQIGTWTPWQNKCYSLYGIVFLDSKI